MPVQELIPNDPVDQFLYYFHKDFYFEAKDHLNKLEAENHPSANYIKQLEPGWILLDDLEFAQFA